MTSRPAPRRTGKAAARVAPPPPGLRSLRLDASLPKDAIDLRGLGEALEDEDFTTAIPTDGYLIGVLDGDAATRGLQVQFSVTAVPEEERNHFSFELAAGELLATKEHRRKSAHAFFRLLRRFLTNPDEPILSVMGATFHLSRANWIPIFDLPFPAPSWMPQLPGAPEIGGVDFVFRSSSPEQPLLRAFLTTYPESQELVVRFLLGHRAPLQVSLPDHMMETASKYLGVFARQAPPTSDAG